MTDKKECVYCDQKIIHPERVTNICLDCVVKALQAKGIIPTVVAGKHMTDYKEAMKRGNSVSPIPEKEDPKGYELTKSEDEKRMNQLHIEYHKQVLPFDKFVKIRMLSIAEIEELRSRILYNIPYSEKPKEE